MTLIEQGLALSNRTETFSSLAVVRRLLGSLLGNSGSESAESLFLGLKDRIAPPMLLFGDLPASQHEQAHPVIHRSVGSHVCCRNIGQ